MKVQVLYVDIKIEILSIRLKKPKNKIFLDSCFLVFVILYIKINQ